MIMKKLLALAVSIMAVSLFGGCATTSDCAASKCAQQPKLEKSMFYKDGKFNQEAAKQAYFDMMQRLGV